MATVKQIDIVLDALESARRPGKAGEYELCCPACADRIGIEDETGNLGINLVKGVFHCWRCGWSGKLSTLIKNFDELTAGHRIPKLDLSSIVPLDWRKRPRLDDEISLPAGYVEVRPGDPGAFAGRVLDYLRGRGFNDLEISRLRPGYTLDEPRRGEIDARGRVILPVSRQGRAVFWQARSWGELTPKVLGPRLAEELHKPVWGLDDVPRGGVLVIAEGILSGCAAGGAASLGAKLTESQIFEILGRFPRRIVLVYDADDAGRAGREKTATVLAAMWPGEVCLVTLPAGQDPADLLKVGRRAELRGLIAEAPRWGLASRLLAIPRIR